MFCYADDLILTSLSVTGLQKLIDTANSYITVHGLKFNPTKTICTTLGCRNFKDTPQLHLNNTILREEAAVTYLGTILSNNTKHHIDTRIKAAHRAFYGRQSAGLCADGVSLSSAQHCVIRHFEQTVNWTNNSVLLMILRPFLINNCKSTTIKQYANINGGQIMKFYFIFFT